MWKITGDSLPEAQPEGPGFYREKSAGQHVVWLSWWKPNYHELRSADGRHRLPLTKVQLTSGEANHPPNLPPEFAAVVGIKLLGAREAQNEGYRHELARLFLHKRKPEDVLADDDRAHTRLVKELVTYGNTLRERLSALPSRAAFHEEKSPEELTKDSPDFFGPPHTLGESRLPREADEILAVLLEGLGSKGKEIAAQIRQKSEERHRKLEAGETSEEEVWQPWLPDLSKGGQVLRHEALAAALWQDRVRPRLEREHRKPPALTRAIHAPVAGLLSSPSVHLEESTGQRRLDVGQIQVRAVHIDTMSAPYVDRGIELFQSIHAHRILRYFVFESHRKAIQGDEDPRLLRFPGGYAALAEACGINGREGAEKVRPIVEAMQSLDIAITPGRTARLFARDFAEAQGRRKAYLSIVVGTALLPDYVFELQSLTGTHSLEARRTHDLIPLLPIPPTIGRPNEQGAQATLSLRVVSHLRDHAVELARQEGAPLTPDEFRQMAHESKLPTSMASNVLDHWQKDQEDGPAFLKRVDKNRFTLGDAHKAERTFLERSGHLRTDAREAGRRSVAKREAARRKIRGQLRHNS